MTDKPKTPGFPIPLQNPTYTPPTPHFWVQGDISSIISSTTASVSSSSVILFEQTKAEFREPASNHPIYNLIGRTAAKMGLFEHELDKIIWRLAGIPDDIGTCITSATMGHGNRFHIIILMKTLGLEERLIEKMAGLGKVANDAAEARSIIRDTPNSVERNDRHEALPILRRAEHLVSVWRSRHGVR